MPVSSSEISMKFAFCYTSAIRLESHIGNHGTIIYPDTLPKSKAGL
ncbi:hypothetical protein [Gimesia fumaroli]|nr:hypothetical protein [Gimesia fumaroli]